VNGERGVSQYGAGVLQGRVEPFEQFRSPFTVHRSRFSIENLPRRVLAALIRAYQVVISPALPPACRFTPTCSQYALEAVGRYGALRGSCLAARRLVRCHPFNRGGFDPVP
jgi:putative membrane protein insertion efficiency factor